MTLLQDHRRSAVATAPLSDSPLLDVRNLMTEFKMRGGWLRAVNDVSFTVPRGKVLGILGESGAGKSALLRTVLGVQPRTASVGGQVLMNESREMPGVMPLPRSPRPQGPCPDTSA